MKMNNSRNIIIKLDKRKTKSRDITVGYFEGKFSRNEFSFNSEYLSWMPNYLWMLFSMEIYGHTENIKPLNEAIRKLLDFKEEDCDIED